MGQQNRFRPWIRLTCASHGGVTGGVGLGQIKIDGVSEATNPVCKAEGEGETSRLEVAIDLLDLHEWNVETTTEYHASMLNALLGALK